MMNRSEFIYLVVLWYGAIASAMPVWQDASVALSGTDLFAFRACADLCPDWREGLSPTTRRHLVESAFTLVVAHDDDSWQLSGGAIELTDVPGEAGDYETLHRALLDKRFRTIRCLLWRDQHRTAPAGEMCTFLDAVQYINSEAPEADREALNEFAGAAIAKLPDAERNLLIEDAEFGRAAEAALSQFVAAESRRQELASQYAQLNEADPNVFQNAVVALWGRTDLLNPRSSIQAGPYRGAENVFPFDTSSTAKFYLISTSPEEEIPTALDMDTVYNRLLSGHWVAAISRTGSDNVVRLNISEEMIESLRSLRDSEIDQD